MKYYKVVSKRTFQKSMHHTIRRTNTLKGVFNMFLLDITIRWSIYYFIYKVISK